LLHFAEESDLGGKKARRLRKCHLGWIKAIELFFECKALVLWTVSWNADMCFMGAASPRDAPCELQSLERYRGPH
jgi:hypothetical protein